MRQITPTNRPTAAQDTPFNEFRAAAGVELEPGKFDRRELEAAKA